MSAKLIQEKCGRREKMPKFARGGLALLNAALDLWCLHNGFATGRAMRESIVADFRARNGGTAER